MGIKEFGSGKAEKKEGEKLRSWEARKLKAERKLATDPHGPTQTVSFPPGDVVGRKNCMPFGQSFILSFPFGYATFIFAKR